MREDNFHQEYHPLASQMRLGREYPLPRLHSPHSAKRATRLAGRDRRHIRHTSRCKANL